MSNRFGWVAALLCGVMLWSFATLALGDREPWDSSDYWMIWYPSALALSALLGLIFPTAAWRWPVVLMLMQMPVMMFITGGGASLLPLGLMLLLVLAVPGMLLASIAVAIVRRVGLARGS